MDPASRPRPRRDGLREDQPPSAASGERRLAQRHRGSHPAGVQRARPQHRPRRDPQRGAGDPAAAGRGERLAGGQPAGVDRPHPQPVDPGLPGRGDADVHTVGDRDAPRDGDGHGDGDRDGDEHADAEPDADADADRHDDGHAQRDRHRDHDAGRGGDPLMATDQLFADRYRLERRLGVGGMATVQLAFDTRLERYVAVKLLAEHLAEDSNFVSRFRREALAVARLVHPNIVQVFDFGSDTSTGRNFIVMEYVDGQSCAEILRDRGPLTPRDAVDILCQACRGLDYAHRNGVVHRDVKPGNLMRNTDGVVKLADFGIAKAAEQSDITKVGSVLGTAAYLSPEQTRGQPAEPGSDIYALGVVSYQLMSGRLPYEAASLTDLARLQEAGAPLALDELNRD